MRISRSIPNDENIAFTITFKDLIDETVLNGLRTLRDLKDFKLAEL